MTEKQWNEAAGIVSALQRWRGIKASAEVNDFSITLDAEGEGYRLVHCSMYDTSDIKNAIVNMCEKQIYQLTQQLEAI